MRPDLRCGQTRADGAEINTFETAFFARKYGAFERARGTRKSRPAGPLLLRLLRLEICNGGKDAGLSMALNHVTWALDWYSHAVSIARSRSAEQSPGVKQSLALIRKPARRETEFCRLSHASDAPPHAGMAMRALPSEPAAVDDALEVLTIAGPILIRPPEASMQAKDETRAPDIVDAAMSATR